MNVLITGVTGMDGSILAEQLLAKGMQVYGLIRRSASPNTWRIDHLIGRKGFHLVDGDLTDPDSLYRAMAVAEPKWVFNLGAQSFVPYSWSAPVNTFQVTAVGVLNLLEAIRNTDKSIRFYQASSSEMFGKVLETPQKETTPFYPRSPYGVAKAAAHYATINYAESFGIHATSGILFNHEHERRGEHFVTRKVTKGLATFFEQKMKGLDSEPVRLGNLAARRDWGYAEDYTEAMQRIIAYAEPASFVIATGKSHTVRALCEAAAGAGAKALGTDQQIEWRGQGDEEVGYFDNAPIVAVSNEFYRPAEVDLLQGDASKAKAMLGWQPTTSFETMIEKMFNFDFQKAPALR